MRSIRNAHGELHASNSTNATARVEFPQPVSRSRYHHPAQVAPIAAPNGLTLAERKSGAELIDGSDRALNLTQVALDVAGLVPGIGEVADGANALISLQRGNYTDAALSAAAAIPVVGWVATAGKAVVKMTQSDSADGSSNPQANTAR